MRHSVSVTCCALLVSSFSLAYAADVPGGTVLAEKQELVRHIKDEPASLDPAKAVGLPEIQVIRDLFEGLVNQNEKGEIIPGVASQWKSNDNRIWTFTLRDDAQWADGTPVTAQDFVYSWQRLVDPKTLSPFAWFAALAGITNAQAIIDGKVTPDQLGVSAVDAHTLRIQLDKPLPWFASLTASFAFYPVQKANVESGKDWMKPGKLIGNGAYVLKERVVNEKLVVVPNTHYWDNAKTVLQKVTFLPINQESAATKRYLAGDIDITESFPKNMYQKLLKDIPGQVYTPPQLGTYYYAFNTQKGPTADSRVRLALSMTIDRRLMAEKVLGTGEKPAWHFTPDVTAGFTPDPSPFEQMSQEELNAQAKTLLRAAGYGSQKPLNKGDDHFTARRAVHGKRFFTEDNDDAKSDYAQHHTRDILVVQQPGGDRNQNDNTHDGQQQITEVDRFKVGFGTVAFHPALAESKVNDGYQHTDDTKRKRGAPAITRRQPRRRQHREEGADVDGHIIHRKCAVETRIILRVAGRQQGRRVSFKQTVTHSDSRHAHIDDASVMTRPCDQRITDSQHHGTQHNNAFGAQNFIT